MERIQLDNDQEKIFNQIKDMCICDFIPIYVSFMYKNLITYIKNCILDKDGKFGIDDRIAILSFFFTVEQFYDTSVGKISHSNINKLVNGLSNFEKILSEFKEAYKEDFKDE